MGWCYTFGVNCDSGCKHPMLVRETLDACECEVCGISCTGRFANCWRSIFQANGRVVQMRCLPPSIPQSAEAASADELVEETEPLITDVPVQGGPGGGAGIARPGEGIHAIDAQESGAHIEQDLAVLQERVSEVLNLIHGLSLENSELRRELASIAARLETMDSPLASMDSPLASMDSPLASMDSPLRPVTHVIRPTSDSAESFTRPGRAVAHPDVVHRQHHAESHQSVDEELLTHPLAEGSGGGLG